MLAAWPCELVFSLQKERIICRPSHGLLVFERRQRFCHMHLFEQMRSIRILTVPPIFASARFADLVTLKEVAEVRTLWALQTRLFLLLHITSLSERARFVRCLGVQICTSFDSELRSVCATWQGGLKRFKLGSCKLQRKKQRQGVWGWGCCFHVNGSHASCL